MAKKKQHTQTPSSATETGTVVKNTGSAYLVMTHSGQTLNCRIKGNFRIKGIRTTNPVAVGDVVAVADAADDAHYIVSVAPRRNYIIRRASNLSKESHILAANLDMAVVVASLRDPMTPTTFIDRFLATAEAYGVPAAVAFNKSDLWDSDDRELADALRTLYQSIGYTVLFLSAKTGSGLEQLRDLTKDKTTLLAGNSGVGKSSLINDLVPDASLKTGEISDLHHTGTHTTTFSEMLPLPYGGHIIDIPGVKAFGTIDFNPEEVGHFFPEIFRQSHGCRYGNCKHTGEPGCAVTRAVADHYISESRYASYLSVLEETMEKEGADKYRSPF